MNAGSLFCWVNAEPYLLLPCAVVMCPAATDELTALDQVDIKAGHTKYCETGSRALLDPWGIDTTRTGMILFTCMSTHSLYCVHPTSGEVERIAGTGSAGAADLVARSEKATLSRPQQIVVVDDRHCGFICDAQNYAIRCASLPPHLFHSR